MDLFVNQDGEPVTDFQNGVRLKVRKRPEKAVPCGIQALRQVGNATTKGGLSDDSV